MTPRERILASFDHIRPDRTPTAIWARPEVIRDVATRLGCEPGEVNSRLGIEGWGGVGLGFTFPGWADRDLVRLEGDFPYAGHRVELLEPDVFRDEWGVVRRIGRDRKYVEWLSGPLQELTEPHAEMFPGPDRIADAGSLAERVADQQARGLVVSGGLGNAFKHAWELRGLQNLLMDYLINRPFLEALYDQIYATQTEIARRYAAAGVDMISFVGDISMQDRLIMSPAAWREVDKPRMAHLVAETWRVNPDVRFYIHSDGNYEEIIEDLITIGFTILNPIQPECMDPVRLKRLYGDRVTLHGTGSLQRTLPFGTVEQVRAEVVHRITYCGYDGGLVLMPSNVIQPDTPVDNVIAYFETARDFDLSSLPAEPPDLEHAPPFVLP